LTFISSYIIWLRKIFQIEELMKGLKNMMRTWMNQELIPSSLKMQLDYSISWKIQLPWNLNSYEL